ncbi:MAG: FG-GAP repeat domain-containing protein [Candidatus Binatia bacterium]
MPVRRKQGTQNIPPPPRPIVSDLPAGPPGMGIVPQLAVQRNGTFLLEYTGDTVHDRTAVHGTGEDIGVVGDFNGDTFSDIAVYRNGTWIVTFRPLDGSGAEVVEDQTIVYGARSDIPQTADVNGNGFSDLVLYSPNTGRWQINFNRGAIPLFDRVADIDSVFWRNDPRDRPVLGDFTGDGKANRALFNNGIWYFDFDWDGLVDGTCSFGLPANRGGSSDIPLTGDFNSDGFADLVLFRDGNWYVSFFLPYQEGGSYCTGLADVTRIFGQSGDRPLVGVFSFVFAVRTLSSSPSVTAAVADLDGDGWVETLGAHNDGQGNLQQVDLLNPSVGLASLFSCGRPNRDGRFADFTGDGLVDLISNVYADAANANAFSRLFRGVGNGSFVEETAARLGNLGDHIRGHGETIVVADFDNDSDIDIFIPHYSHSCTFPPPSFTCAVPPSCCDSQLNDPSQCPLLRSCQLPCTSLSCDDTQPGRSYLLINDGFGHFTDRAEAAGVSLPALCINHRPEGAQAVDINHDGWIDLYVAGHLFINNRNLTFTNRRAELGLPSPTTDALGLFDEGSKFIDWNNDGGLDLVLHHPNGTDRLFQSQPQTRVFTEQTTGAFRNPFDGTVLRSSFGSNGVNVYDLNNDGREDIIVSGQVGTSCRTTVYLNLGTRFVKARTTLDAFCGGTGAPAFADFDRDGRADMVFVESAPSGRRLVQLLNRTALAYPAFAVQVHDTNGARNQFGRTLSISPLMQPAVKLTRIVDGGSGYLSQSQYTVLVGTPYRDDHVVTVHYATRPVTCTLSRREVFSSRTLHVYADGRCVVD